MPPNDTIFNKAERSYPICNNKEQFIFNNLQSCIQRRNAKFMYYQCYFAHFFFSCSSIDFELPQGPQGTNGKSAYEIWKEEVETGHINWPSTQVDLADFLVYIKGEKGDKGKDGMSAYDQWKILITQGNCHQPS